MRKRIAEILGTRTIRESGVTFTGTFLNGILGVVFYALTARYLGPSGFGIFSVSVAALTLVADISSLGTDTGIVRFVGKYIQGQREKALRFLKISLEIKVIVWIIVLVVGFLAAPFVAESILSKPELTLPLRLAMFGVGTGLLFSFTTNALQAIQKFWIWSALNVFSNSVRLFALVIVAYLGLLSVISGLAIYIGAPLLGFLVGFLFLPNFFTVPKEWSIASELLHYNKWVAIFTAIAAVTSRLDSFISTRFLTLQEVGIYSVAVSLSSIVPQIVFALGAVVAPKLSSLRTDEEAFAYLKKLQTFTAGLCGLGIVVGIPLSLFIIPAFYGDAYRASISPFIVLLLAQAIFLFSVPVHTGVIYYFGYPKLFVWISLIQLAIVGGLGWLLVSNFGYIGAAIAILVGDIFGFIIPAVWILGRFKAAAKK